MGKKIGMIVTTVSLVFVLGVPIALSHDHWTIPKPDVELPKWPEPIEDVLSQILPTSVALDDSRVQFLPTIPPSFRLLIHHDFVINSNELIEIGPFYLD